MTMKKVNDVWLDGRPLHLETVRNANQGLKSVFSGRSGTLTSFQDSSLNHFCGHFIAYMVPTCLHENLSIIYSLMNLFNEGFSIARGRIRMWMLQKCNHANSQSLFTVCTYINNQEDILKWMHLVIKHNITKWRLILMLMTACSLIILIQPQKHTYTASTLLPMHTGSTDCVQELRYDILANSFACSCALHQWA